MNVCPKCQNEVVIKIYVPECAKNHSWYGCSQEGHPQEEHLHYVCKECTYSKWGMCADHVGNISDGGK